MYDIEYYVHMEHSEEQKHGRFNQFFGRLWPFECEEFKKQII